jgi:tetratricopeptide (TPR) repeat protein
LGTIEQQNGHLARAVAWYRAALAIMPALGDAEPVLQGSVWVLLGAVLTRMGHLDEALDAHERARAIFEEASRAEKAGAALQERAGALLRGGEYDAALLFSERARSLYEQHEHLQMTSRARDALGLLLVQQGHPREAIEHFAAGLVIKQWLRDAAGECQALTELARCHLLCGEVDHARELADRAVAQSREAGLPDEAARAQIILGVISAGEDPRIAQRLLQQAAGHCEKAMMRPEAVMACRVLARLAASQGRYRDAAVYQNKAFEALRGVGPQDLAAALSISDLMRRSAVPGSP